MKAIVFLAAALTALSASAAPDEGATLYAEKTCVACHGKDAKKPLMKSYPKIAGQNADYIVQQMLDIQSGARANGQSAAMKGVMHLVTEAEIKTLAVYLSKLPS